MSSATVAQILITFANIHNVLRNRLQQGGSDLKDFIYCTRYLNSYSMLMGLGTTHCFTRFPLPFHSPVIIAWQFTLPMSCLAHGGIIP